MWFLTLQIGQIQLPGLLRLEMRFIKDFDDMDVTGQLQLEGTFSQTLVGPTPGALVAQVPAGLLDHVLAVPGAGFVQPAHTQPSAMADDPNNWRE